MERGKCAASAATPLCLPQRAALILRLTRLGCTRADQARSRRAGGAGLGLAIAQTIAQAHGGEITVSSRIGKGSCFQVELPTA
ncbi:hypothetical protein H6F67_26385 [Microcoleus sp. FACHB-1515]|nr:hypothetical protein [Microcoleus sp. FACHB-1515]